MSSATVVMCFIFTAAAAEARLGETLAQCEMRYGPVVEKRAPEVKESDPDACVFSKSGTTAVVEFKGGTAWRIVFRKAGMTGKELESLLKANMPEGGWGAAVKVNGREYRLSADRRRIANYMPAVDKHDVPALEIVTRDYATACHAGYAAKVSEVLGQKRVLKTQDGLKGF